MSMLGRLDKPDEELTQYERDCKYGLGGDPLKINPMIQTAMEEIRSAKGLLSAREILGKVIRAAKGNLNPGRVMELAQAAMVKELENVGGVMDLELQLMVTEGLQISCKNDWVTLGWNLRHNTAESLVCQYDRADLEAMVAVRLKRLKEANPQIHIPL